MIAEDGRSCKIKITPPQYLYRPSTVACQNLSRGHVVFEAIKDWLLPKKSI